MPTWWVLLPTLLVMTVTLVLSGFMWLRVGGRSSLVAIGTAPAFTFDLITVLSAAYPVPNIEQEPSATPPILGMSILGGAGAWNLSSLRHSNNGFSLRGAPLREVVGVRKPIDGRQVAIRVTMWGAILVGFVLAALPLMMGAAPSNPIQQWDPTFHQNSVYAMLHGKNASPFDGLHELYGGRSVYYPTGWHIFVLLFACYDSVIQVSNVPSLALMTVWVIGLVVLVSVLTVSRNAIMTAPIIDGLLLNTPVDTLTIYNQRPNSVSTIPAPGPVAVTIVMGRRLATNLRVDKVLHAFLRRTPQVVLFLIGAIGLVGARPSVVFSILTFLVASPLASIVFLARHVYSHGGRGQLVALTQDAIVFVVVAALLPVLSSSKIRAMSSYRRDDSNWGEAFGHAFLPYPPFSNTAGNVQWMIVQLILLTIGIMAVARLHLLLRRTNPLERAAERVGLTNGTGVEAEEGTLALAQEIKEAEEEAQPPPFRPSISYTILVAFIALAYSPGPALCTYLLTPQYKDARCVMGVEDITLMILTTVNVAAIVRLIHTMQTGSLQRILTERRTNDNTEASRQPVRFAVGLLVLVLSGFGTIDAQNATIAQVCDPDRLGEPGMATIGKLAMLRHISYMTASDALTLGGLITGAAYSEMIDGRKAISPQLSTTNKDMASQKILIQRFHGIGADLEVCEVVHKLGIAHFYEEEDGAYYNFMRSSCHPGLYNVDTSTGFRLVDAGGTVKLWKITACGEATLDGGREAFANGVTGSCD